MRERKCIYLPLRFLSDPLWGEEEPLGNNYSYAGILTLILHIVMRKLLVALLCLVSLSASAQDLIICRNGDEITSKILKISKTEVEYKKWSNIEGPTYTLDKADIFMIKYQNGEKDVFKETPAAAPAAPAAEPTAASAAPVSNEPIMATPAANNAELIAGYNNEQHEYVLKYPDPAKKKVKESENCIGTLGVSSSSILSTDDIEISFQRKFTKSCITSDNIGDDVDPYFSNDCIKYAIIIKNKSSRVIYIDKSACFGTFSTGEIKKYYDPQEYSVTEGKDSGAGMSVNLGAVADAFGVGGAVGALADGVNVGGDKGKFNVTTKTYKDERLLTIPPMSSVALSADNLMKHPYKKKRYLITGAYEYFRIPNLSFKVDELGTYTEENTPISVNYMITYSFGKELSQCYMVNFGLYLKDAFGVNKKSNVTLYLETEQEINEKIKYSSPKTIIVYGDNR